MSEENLKTTYNMFYRKFSGDNIHNERIKQSITNGLLGLALLMDVFTDLGLDFKEATGYSSKDNCKFYNKPTCFHVANTYNGTKKTFRAAVLVVDKLKENNIDVDFMVD